MERFGRRISMAFLNIFKILGWLIFIFAESVPTLFIARLVHGIGIGGLFINALIIGEYSHPTRRGYYSAIKKICGALGSLTVHGMSLIWSWRQIAAVSLLPPFLSLVVCLFWPESPSHLALKGRFAECEKSFTWLRGTSFQSRMELNELIATQKENRDKIQRSFFEKIRDRTFLKSFLLVSLLSIIIDTCGRFYFVAYVIQIMVEITGDRSVATFCSLGSDCLSIIALLSSCYVIRTLKRRTVLLVFGGFSVLLMFLIGFIKLFKSATWLIPAVLLLHNFVIYLSVIPVCYTMFGELIPLEFRAIGGCSCGIVIATFYAVTLKITPILMEHTGVQGTYAIYGVSILMCLAILYYILPETKDKTLQQIENELSGAKRDEEIKPMFEENKVP
ncbi:uncharacterized protein LOC126378138 [Pectinophora gossypiella]|uniref:uncharacterized protein LOC126378138 n=1 Tax=Pectinophora gossypiella TaxID=13191 RepID=UPI00214F15F0|nr:uncharacterized protein LOC126378138 [Pectinophora gossypiella]